MASINRRQRSEPVRPLPERLPPLFTESDWNMANFEFNNLVHLDPVRQSMAFGPTPPDPRALLDVIHEGSPHMLTADDFREQLKELRKWAWADDVASQRRMQRFIAALEIAIEVTSIAEKVNRSLHRDGKLKDDQGI